MPQAVGPDLYRIPVPLPHNPLKSLNAYLVRGRRNLLIDTGFRQDACRRALLEGLSLLGVAMADTDIFLTHLHTDHSGLASELIAPGGHLFVSGTDRTRLPGRYDETDWQRSDAWFLAHGMPQAVLDAVRGQNPMRALAPLPYDGYETVADGDILEYGPYRLRCLATPGHTPGHLCLWDQTAGVFFSGDHVLFDITPNITCWAGVPDALGDYLRSLAGVRDLSPRLVLPGHRESGSLAERVDQLLGHHNTRCAQALALIGAFPEAPTAYQIASRLHWDIRARCWEAFPPAQQWFALGETLAHLEHLRVLGLAQTLSDGTLIRWQLCQPTIKGERHEETA